MTTFLFFTYMSFYFFSRIKIAHQESNDDAEEFANRIILIPFLIEMIAISIFIIEIAERIIGKENNE